MARKKTFIRIDRKRYDDLCHFVRHLTLEVERFDQRSDKFYRVIQDLALEMNESKKTLMAKVKRLDKALNNIGGSVLDCESCLNRKECLKKNASRK